MVEFVPQLRRHVGAHGKLVLDEKKFPALADIHLGLEGHGDPVRPLFAPQHHLLQPDDAGCLPADRGAGTGNAYQPHPHDLDHGALVRVLDQGAVEPIVAAHELGGEQAGRLRVEINRGPLLLDVSAIEQRDAVGDRHRLDLIVRHQQGGEIERNNECPQPGPGLLAQLRVEIG